MLPPSKVNGASVSDSLVGDGCRIDEGSVVKRSVIGSCAYIEEKCYIKVRPGSNTGCGNGCAVSPMGIC